MKKLSLVLTLVIFAMGFAMAQRTITGTVTDTDGEPLIGASILVKGTSSGTVTDIDGNFTLEVPQGSNTLLLSYTGFASKSVQLTAASVMNITLEESAEELSEVLVTAIGIKREKKSLGYSVSDLSGDDLAQRSEVDPVRAIAGKTPGVAVQGAGGAPGMSTKINIRGNSSLTGNTQPLFVVDGIPFDNSVNPTTSASGGTQFSNRAFDIDPNNIESMTILKGAAAAALYGSRATNGVVVITTKTGSKNARKGLEVTYNSSFQVEELSGIPDYQNVYGQGSNQSYNGGFIGNWGSPFATEVDRLNSTYVLAQPYSKVIVPGYPEGTVPHPLVSTSVAVADGYPDIFPELLDANGNAMAVPYRPYDIIDPFFETGRVWENSININAGLDKGALTSTVSRMDNKGIVPNSGTSRTSLSFGGNSQLGNGLLVSGNVTYVNTTQENPPIGGSIFGGNFGTDPGSLFTRLFFLPRNFDLNGVNPEGIPYPFENPVNGNNIFYRRLDNPLWLAKYNKYESDVNRVYGNITLSYDVTPWLNMSARGGINTYSDNRKNISRPGGDADRRGTVWTDNLTNTEIDFNYIATVQTQLSENIDFRIIGGFNVNQREYSSRFVQGEGVISVGLYNTNTTESQQSREYNELRRYFAAYGDIQLGYKDYLYLGIVARNDWSSTLPQGNNSFFYPGVNTSFVFTDALGIANDILGYGKVRAAWTQVGNEAGPYRTNTVYRINQAGPDGPFTAPSGSVFNRASLDTRLGNPGLTHELTTEIEFGTDLRFFRNRLGIDLTWFKRNSTDQITAAAVPTSSGFSSQVVNAGEIENKGIELGVDITPIKTASGFSWNTYVNFTQIKTTVIDAGEAGELIIPAYNSSLATIHRTGEPYGQILGSQNARTPEGDLLIDKTTGLVIFYPDARIIGDPNPDFMMGFVNTFSFKNFTLRALIDWRQGGDMYFTTAGALVLRGQLKITEDREALRVIPGVYGDPRTQEAVPGENGGYVTNTTPITSFDYHFSDAFGPYGADETNVYDITTIRLREVAIGYEFPKALLAKTPFGSARLSISGRNLWFNAPNVVEGLNMDPEVLAETAESNVQGFEYGSAPTTRRYGVNLSVTF